MTESVERTREGFSAMAFIDEIAAVSRADGVIPDEKSIGRECHAFSDQEDASFRVAEKAAREILRGREDYTISHDAIGNMFIRLGSNPHAKAVMMGSHLDSVANGGKYDGVAGVAMALKTLETLTKQDQKPPQDFIVAVWRSEESSPKNGVALLGSAIATGRITPEKLESIVYDKASNTKLRDHFIARYGEARWQDVLSLARNPRMTHDRIALKLEPHIEQSDVIAKKGKDIGIVIGGIGGSRRDVIEKQLEPEKIKTHEGEYRKVTMSFHGEAAHTGGAPPNPHFYDDGKQVVWYRKDALVAASVATNNLLRGAELGAKLLMMGPKSPTGFTSVPSHHVVELLVPSDARDVFLEKFKELKGRMQKEFHVTMHEYMQEYSLPEAAVVTRVNARAFLDLPQIVSGLSTEALHREREQKPDAETGTTRATVTDFYLTPDKLSYNLDLREVSVEDLDRLIAEIHKHTDLFLGDGARKMIACKVHAPIDEALAAALQKHAEELGITFELMSSHPGHDAGNMADSGIPTAMLFIKHDGRSHHPGETVAERDFANAASVAERFILNHQVS